jgi:hypothetical protein
MTTFDLSGGSGTDALWTIASAPRMTILHYFGRG